MAQCIDWVILRGGSEKEGRYPHINYDIYDRVTMDSRSFEQSYAFVQVSDLYGIGYVITATYMHRDAQKIEAVGAFRHNERELALEMALQKARVLATERAKSMGVPLEDEIYIREQHLSRAFKNSGQTPTRPREGALSGTDDVGRA